MASEHQTTAAEIIARCRECGREFVLPPQDGVDRYPPIYDLSGRAECGGKVEPLKEQP